MMVRFFAFLLLATQQLCPAQNSGIEKSKRLAVEVEMAVPRPGTYVLKVTVQNVTTVPVSLSEWQLPWGNRYSLTTTALATGRIPQTLRENFPIDDPNVGRQVVLQPGERRSGDVDLSGRFRTINQVLRQTDVIVYWLYQFGDKADSKIDYSAGWLVIPKIRPN